MEKVSEMIDLLIFLAATMICWAHGFYFGWKLGKLKGQIAEIRRGRDFVIPKK